MELWDAYDIHGNLFPGKILVRGEAIPEGCFHLVCDILVRHADGTFLLMQRDACKYLGGLWEASAGGSALLGETPADCARRELQEETGIIAGHMQELGRVVHHGHHALYVEYLCVTNQDKDSVQLQEGETQGYRWVDVATLASMPHAELATKRMWCFLDGMF